KVPLRTSNGQRGGPQETRPAYVDRTRALLAGVICVDVFFTAGPRFPTHVRRAYQNGRLTTRGGLENNGGRALREARSGEKSEVSISRSARYQSSSGEPPGRPRSSQYE